MNEFRVTSFAELHDVLGRQRRDAGWIYRGHAQRDWSLVPRAGRPPFADGHDEVFFRHWKSEAAQYVEEPPSDDWNWLAIAQHHGFATRLLDWTTKPLAAVFFAVFEPGRGDAAVYAFKTSKSVHDPAAKSPFEVQGVTQFLPRRVTSRVSRQIGVFTHHNPPPLSVESGMSPLDKLECIVIDADYRRELLFELNQYGINNQSLFPDLVGLSRHFSWIMASFDYWARGLAGMDEND